jgi:hypothetical protein
MASFYDSAVCCCDTSSSYCRVERVAMLGDSVSADESREADLSNSSVALRQCKTNGRIAC